MGNSDDNMKLLFNTLWLTSKLWQRLFIYVAILGISYVVMSFFVLMGNWMIPIDKFCGTTRLNTNFLKEFLLYLIAFGPGVLVSLIFELEIRQRQRRLGKHTIREIKENTYKIIKNE
ncbi:hypothetical protein [Sulfurospirillum sp.]|uniref:hypothetical protein n=1 Tax=Sulfurospirillum sp. TaxID=2053622 RepID=UPI002FDE15E5